MMQSVIVLSKLFYLFICNFFISQIDFFIINNKDIKHIYYFHQLLKQNLSCKKENKFNQNYIDYSIIAYFSLEQRFSTLMNSRII